MALFRCSSCGATNRVADARLHDNPVCGGCKARLDTSGVPQTVAGEAFERAIASSPVPVLVDFWAEWCGPCHAAAPAVTEVGRRNAGKLAVLKVNVDEDGANAGKHGIRSIPAFLLFQDGREVARRTGVMSRAELEAWVARSTRSAA